jgi:exosortase
LTGQSRETARFLHKLRDLLAHPFAPVVLQLLALWPVWQWYGRRFIEGADEMWGLVALCAALGLFWRERRHSCPEPRPALLWSAGILSVLSAAGSPWLHMLPRAILGMAALGLTLAAVLERRRPTLPIWGLLALSLPVVSSTQLQLYLGYPLRAFTAWASRGMLAILGIEVVQTGTALTWMGRTVLVDAPCSGIRMLWVGMLLAALLSYLAHASGRRFVLNAAAALPIILFGNVSRNTALFVKEAGILPLPAWTHAGIGLLAFTLVAVSIVGFARWRSDAGAESLRGDDAGGRPASHGDPGVAAPFASSPGTR